MPAPQPEPETELTAELRAMGCPYLPHDSVRVDAWLEGYKAGMKRGHDDGREIMHEIMRDI